MRRAVFLDRDGVLNRAVVRGGKPYPPAGLEELEVLPGVPDALARLRADGFMLIGVTNQPDVARGTTPREVVDAINSRLISDLGLDEIAVCFHDDADACRCRKPAPGLLLDAAGRYNIALDRSFMVGDRWKDTEAGHQAGCITIRIDAGYVETEKGRPPHHRCSSLSEAAEWILRQQSSKSSSTVVDTTRAEIRKDNIMKNVQELTVKIFADGADRAGMLEMYRLPHISGFTTNPTLMRKAGLSDYQAFARDIVQAIPDRPISFEVFSDEFDEMERQANLIRSWGENVYVKIPVTNTRAEPSTDLVCRLASQGVKLNVTALLTLEQVRAVSAALAGGPSSYISVFAGRIADTGRDPLPALKEALAVMRPYPQQELIWASPRELLNIFQADEIGCHVITVTNDILKKLALVGKDLTEYSLDTVKMFRADALQAGFTL